MTSTQSKTPEGGGQTADAKLLELEKRREEARQMPGETDEETDEKVNRLLELERQIITVPAEGLTGIAVKLRLATSLAKETHFGSPDLPEIGCPQSVLETVERLLKEQGNDADLFELHKEWKRLEKAVEKTDSKADWQATFDAERRFLETPARTLAGVLSKLRVGCLPEHYGVEYQAEDGTPVAPPAVLATLADLERLAGGAA